MQPISGEPWTLLPIQWQPEDDTSFPNRRVTRVLDRVITWRGDFHRTIAYRLLTEGFQVVSISSLRDIVRHNFYIDRLFGLVL